MRSVTPVDEMQELRPALISRRHVFIGGLFAGVAAVSYARMPRRPAKRVLPGTVEALMPNQVGTWTFASSSGVILPPPDITADRIYDNIVTRTYTAPDKSPVMLVIAYSNVQDGMLQIHRPEFCYTAGGFELSPTDDIEIADSAGDRYGANAFIATSRDHKERVLYWTRIGQSFPQSWAQQKLAVVKSNLQMMTPDGLLVRLSMTEDDRGRGLQMLEQFIAEFDRAAVPKLREILFGRRA